MLEIIKNYFRAFKSVLSGLEAFKKNLKRSAHQAKRSSSEALIKRSAHQT